MFSNCFEDTFSNWLFCNSTHMFILNFTVSTYFHKLDDFKHALNLSISFDRGITGNV